MAARVTQEFAEVLRLPTDPTRRLSQEFLEVLRTPTNPTRRVSQHFTEVLVGTFAGLRVTQHFTEVLVVEPAAPPQDVSYTNTTAQFDQLAGDWPWEFTTSTNAIEDVVPNVPMAVSTTTVWEAFSGGDVEGGEVPTVLTLTTIVGAAVAPTLSDPTLIFHSTTVGSVGTLAVNDTITYATVTGARSNKTQIRYDGRRDLLNTTRYRR